jgi:hypothetical protein
MSLLWNIENYYDLQNYWCLEFMLVNRQLAWDLNLLICNVGIVAPALFAVIYKAVSLYVTTDDKLYFGSIKGIMWHMQEAFGVSNIATELDSRCRVTCQINSTAFSVSLVCTLHDHLMFAWMLLWFLSWIWSDWCEILLSYITCRDTGLWSVRFPLSGPSFSIS